MSLSLLRSLVGASAALVLTAGLTGCVPGNTPAPAEGSAPQSSQQDETTAQAAALDRYVQAERSQLDRLLEENPGVYAEVTVDSVAPSTVIFTYTYVNPVDPAEATEYFDSSVDEIQELCDTAVFPGMELAGIEGTKYVTYIYLNPDGSLLWEGTFESS